MRYAALASALAASLLANGAASLQAITRSGNAFYAGTERFYIRGIDYQPGGSSGGNDPLADTTTCKRDIAKFKDLGVNTVRTYMVDNSKNHDECMKALADAGIYLVLDVNNPMYSINRLKPQPSYNAAYLQSVFATVDAFAKYINTLAFFSGNEVINDDPQSTKSAPFVKATTRDIKAYIKARGYRNIPTGYSAADVSSNRRETADYFNCGSDDERSDFFAFNDYSWCAHSTFEVSGWDAKVKNFTDYGLPIFLSEFGCITNKRNFEEFEALMGKEMTSVYSGGLVYEYSNEGNGYGIVDIKDGKVVETPDYSALKTALAKYTLPSGDGGASKESKATKCPAKDAAWLVEDDKLPAIPDKAKAYFQKGAGTGPGLNGPGSQNSGSDAGSTSTGSAPPGSGSQLAGSGSGTGASSGGSGSSGSKSAGPRVAPPMDMGAVAVVCIVGVFTMVGALAL